MSGLPVIAGEGAPLGGSAFPEFVGQLPAYAGRFAANRLAAQDCELLFASYPAGTAIGAHHHYTDNWGVITQGRPYLTVQDEAERSYGPGDCYAVAAGVAHSARFEDATAEIEFWFKAGTMTGES
jgi:quercetin dioxygenase-like cupin family protein